MAGREAAGLCLIDFGLCLIDFAKVAKVAKSQTSVGSSWRWRWPIFNLVKSRRLSQTTGLLLALGNAEVEWIVGELFPELDGFELQSEALAARMFVFEHQGEFRVLVDPKKPEKGRRLYLFTILSGFIPGMCTASTFLRSFTFSITLYLSCGSRLTRGVQDPTSAASKDSSALVFSRNPSIHLCLLPITTYRCA